MSLQSGLHCSVMGNYVQHGNLFLASHDAVVEGNVLNLNGAPYGIVLGVTNGGRASNTIVAQNRIFGGAAGSYGIWADNAEDCTIAHNRIEDMEFGIYAVPLGADSVANRLKILGNQVSIAAMAQRGIRVGGTAQDIEVANNRIEGGFVDKHHANNIAVDVADGASRVWVHHNTAGLDASGKASLAMAFVTTSGAHILVEDNLSEGSPIAVWVGGTNYVHRRNKQITSAPRDRGSVTIAGDDGAAVVSFVESLFDADYYLSVAVAGTTGAPGASALHPYVTEKSPTGFTINLEGVPGPGNSVTLDWQYVR